MLLIRMQSMKWHHALGHGGLALAVVWAITQFFLTFSSDVLDMLINGIVAAIYGGMLLASHHTPRGYAGAVLAVIAGFSHCAWAFPLAAIMLIAGTSSGTIVAMCAATGIGFAIVGWIGTTRPWVAIAIVASGVIAALIANAIGPRDVPVLLSDLAWPTLPLHITTAGSFWWSSLHTTPMRSPIRAHLCAACNYDLRGNTTGVCPECGVLTTADSVA